jgi:hypothetical protein
MTPVVRISDETYQRLQTWAVPLEDKPDDVIRRVLDVAEKYRSDSTATAEAATRLPMRPAVRRVRPSKRVGWQSRTDLYLAIIETLREMNGRGYVDEILPRLKGRISHLLDPYYLDADPGGMERWIHAAHSARMKLVEKGVLKSGSPHGVWELSPTAPNWPQLALADSAPEEVAPASGGIATARPRAPRGKYATPEHNTDSPELGEIRRYANAGDERAKDIIAHVDAWVDGQVCTYCKSKGHVRRTGFFSAAREIVKMADRAAKKPKR